MKLHQVLTGACNAGDRCFAVGSVEGIAFVTYAAGSNIVILSVTFERVQIIPGITHNNVQISCIDCSTDTGKIAAAYGNTVRIYEPTPLVHHTSTHKLDYHWVETGQIQTEFFVRAISWNLEGTRLLLGGRLLQIWTSKSGQEGQDDILSKGIPRSATFQLGAANDSDDEGKEGTADAGNDVGPKSPSDETGGYELAWESKPAAPVRLLSFSPDGTLFATAGMNDCLVKVWYQDKPLLFPSKSMEHLPATSPTCADSSIQYAFEYLAHPLPVLSMEWRKTSKYMPRGSVANMLVTSCEDAICRLWVETVLPEDGLVNINSFDPLAAQNPRFRTHRHKHKFMQRLKHMRHCFQLKRLLKQQNGGKSPKRGNKAVTIPTLFSSYSVHDYHTFGIHGTGQMNGLHFHLAATINAQTDIPLVPSFGDSTNEKGFVVHWLNNKEMHFTLQAEHILQELSKKAVEREESFPNGLSAHDQDEISMRESHHDGEMKRKKLRGTTGDLAKFLREQQEQAKSELPSPNSSQHYLHPDQNILSNTASMYSLTTDVTGVTGLGVPLGDALDHRIEALLKDWHQSPDLLYAVHPLDGSFLVWLVDWLDEYSPGSFRQAQVSFSSRLPNAVPLGDASTLSTHLALFNPFHILDLRHLLHLDPPSLHSPPPSVRTADENEEEDTQSANHVSSSSAHPQPSLSSAVEDHGAPLHSTPSPVVAMVTKHANGSLNLWHLALSDQSKFTHVLSVSHVTRISGHRFRVNNILCHPVLPLLLTTSHHNIVNSPDDKDIFGVSGTTGQKRRKPSGTANQGYCSELILWKVETVGPLGKSGGVKELARINSPHMSAFASVAWIPTVLPSSSLGGLSNSASACFVASDGASLRIYQAVIDARMLLAQVLVTPTMGPHNPFNPFGGQEEYNRQVSCGSSVRVVSEQSTSRPGCILELDAMVEAVHDWKQTQLIHVFQQQLLTGRRLTSKEANSNSSSSTTKTPDIPPTSQRRVPLSQMSATSRMSLMEATQSAVVDLQESQAFNEPFYVVVVEKENDSEPQGHDDSFGLMDSRPSSSKRRYQRNTDEMHGDTVVHVWKLVISSSNEDPIGLTNPFQKRSPGPHVVMKTSKVCTQCLPLPSGVGIVHANPAAGHLSSASIYPACFAPYAIVTACTDNTVRFWRCKLVSEIKDDVSTDESLKWEEWNMISKEGTSMLSIHGKPLSVCVAYSGRIAVAFKSGQSFKGKLIKGNKTNSDSRYFNLVVAIYECESTGGSEWVEEDVIHLKNIRLPRLPPVDPNIDLAYLNEEGEHWFRKRQFGIETLTRNLSHDDLETPDRENGSHERYQPNLQGLLSVPSYATLLTLKKSIEQQGNVCPLSQKNLVQLDWVSKEDGSHILTVGVGHRVLLYTAVSSPSVKEKFNSAKFAKNPKLAKQSSNATSFSHEDVTIRWLRLRSLELRTADGLPPLPMHLSWVRDGIFVVGMDNEMQVYSQWKDTICGLPTGSCIEASSATKQTMMVQEAETDIESDVDGASAYDDDVGEDRDVLDRELHTLAQEEGRMTYAPSMAQLPRASSMHVLAAAQSQNGSKRVAINVPAAKKQPKEPAGSVPTVSLLQDCLPSYGLFEASQIACPVLPQYHPQQLMELLNSGKIRWVKAILAHLVRCIAGHRGVDSDEEDDMHGQSDNDSDVHSGKHWARTRTFSISSPDDSHMASALSNLAAVPKEVTLDYAEISAVPPLPLWLLLAADQGSTNMGDSANNGADSLFRPSHEALEEEDDLDTLLSESPPKRKNRRKHANGAMSAQHLQQQYFQFGPRQAALLTNVLTHTQLPGLSSVDQMHLLALADTLASSSAAHLVASSISTANSADLAKNAASNPGSESSLDTCGLRFLLAARHHSYLLRCLPPAQRATLQKQGIGSSLLAWAFHSEAQDELLQLLPTFTKPNPTWTDYRELGVGWWLRSNGNLRKCIEKLAKAAYQSQGDPLDAALYYLAMKKKNLVWGLFRQARNDRMTQFFSNNFAEERWRKAALKNAYALLGKQRFDHAVAFFLLAGSLKDAVDICLSRMRDIQLAIVITRLYEGDMDSVPPALKRLLVDQVLQPVDVEHGFPEISQDPFLRSMSYWLLAQYTESLNTLLEKRDGNGEMSRTQTVASPSVFNFYIYLRNHPLIIRQQLAMSTQGSGSNKRTYLAGIGAISVDKTYLLQEWITPLERRLYFTTAHAHFLAGCPALALEVLSKLPDHVHTGELETNENGKEQSETPKEKPTSSEGERADNFDWSTPQTNFATSKPSDTLDLDWSQPVNTKNEENLELKWSDDENSDSEASDSGITMRKASDPSKAPQIVEPNLNNEPKGEAEQESGGLDIMAQQLKFIACLKILMAEMATLATGFEVDGGQLRLQLYLWLDKELQALQQLCNYAPVHVAGSAEEEDEPSLLPAIPASYKQPGAADQPVTLHEILLAEKLDLEAKVKRTNRRRRWLKANELLVRTLLSYCSVHGSQGGGLASVRMELILLLQELQQDRRFSSGCTEPSSAGQAQLSSPLAYPTSLPLLAASVAGAEVIMTDPVRHLESQIRDLLRAINGLNCVPVPGKVSFGQMCLIRDLALALSACLYQALCTSDAWTLQQQQQQQQQQGTVGPLARLAVVFRAMHNIGVSNNSRRDEQLQPTSSPAKWPGVTSLRALLAREKDEDAPRLLTLLCEAFVAVYTSLLCYSMAACDSHVLYRLAGLQPSEIMWGAVYGGGAKQLVRVTTSTSSLQGSQSLSTIPDSASSQGPPSPNPSTTMDLAKQRVRLHIKLLQQIGTPASVGGGMTASSSTNGGSSSRKPSLPPSNEDMPTYKEVFVAPKLSLVACLMKKPVLPDDCADIDYDSAASDAGDVSDEDLEQYDSDNDDIWEELDASKRAKAKKLASSPGDTEHNKADSISWHAIRLAVTKLCIGQMEEFLRVAGVEPQDLPVVSPLSHAIQRTLHLWGSWLQKQLEAAGPAPLNFIPGCAVEQNVTGPPVLKYRSLLDPRNTPFTAKDPSARPIRRLWSYLVRQEKVQDIFIRLVFGKRRSGTHGTSGANADSVSVSSDLPGQDDIADNLTAVSGGGAAERLQDPVRIIHKDQDMINAFCINSTNPGIMALTNGKEIQELDITPLLDVQSSVLEDECELDLLSLDKDVDVNASSYLVIQTPGDRNLLSQLNGGMSGSASTAHFPSYAPSASNSAVPPGGPALHVTGRGTTMPKGYNFPGAQHPPFLQLVLRRSKLLLKPLRKHKVEGVRRMAPHPSLPLYIAGQGDGSVSIWEWGHVGVVAQPRTPGAYAKVNRLRFNCQGNKFGVADGDGHVALWTLRLGGGSAPHRPFFSHQCHSKGTADFVFLGSSSVLATTGHSSESRNVAIWDTLMPQRKAVVHSFVCHENGGTCLLYAAQHQLLISAGRKGVVCLWDLRQRTLRHKFTAHESSVAVKCMALDPNEDFFATGSADGDIKIWSLATQHLAYAFPAEHSRSSFFRSMGQGSGVNQLHLDSSGRLFSCGSDGSMKLRQLPFAGVRDSIVSTLY